MILPSVKISFTEGLISVLFYRNPHFPAHQPRQKGISEFFEGTDLRLVKDNFLKAGIQFEPTDNRRSQGGGMFIFRWKIR